MPDYFGSKSCPNQYYIPTDSDSDSGSDSNSDTDSNSDGDVGSEGDKPSLQEQLDLCTCHSCRNGKQNWLQIFEEKHASKPHDMLLNKCLCERVEHPDLTIPGSKDPYRLHKMDCAKRSCDKCGVDSSLPWDCPVFVQNKDKVSVWLWIKHKNDSERTVKEQLSISEVVAQLKEAMNNYIPHKIHAEYLNQQR